mmetsp:Transcript_16579/g.15867  ORF Transcript_16579/g.15867 Transcript_16579/m.15867 type:complete len:96 (+) Transcript_16579:917-1204(+)
MNIFEKIKLAAPSKILQKQNILELLQDVGNKWGQEDLKYLYLIDGTRIKSLVMIPLSTRVLVASNSKIFSGIESLDQVETNVICRSSRSRDISPP